MSLWWIIGSKDSPQRHGGKEKREEGEFFFFPFLLFPFPPSSLLLYRSFKVASVKIARIIPVAFLCAVIIFFIIKKDGFSYYDPAKGSIFYISSYLLATEAGLLLIYCLWYTNKIIREDKLGSASSYPIFWIVGGLTLYTSVSFFIFLFYDYLNAHYDQFLVSTWDVHNLLLIILCSCIAIAFYVGSRK